VNSPFSFTAVALPGIPLVKPGDDLVHLIQQGIRNAETTLQDGDVLVIASKVVSKSEGRYVRIADVTPGEEAVRVAEVTAKDPRIVEMVLSESKGISRMAKNILVTEHRLGFISANSGVDASNVDGGESILLLPENPDATAHMIRDRLRAEQGIEVAIIISDTHGRPFRVGNIGVAIGVAGLLATHDLRGQPDLFGRKLEISVVGYADLVASAAHLLCGEAGEGRPITLLRGLDYPRGEGKASDLNRVASMDLYR
jgi:coenzyme F420-0:L-glutamate ligase / coenzyme F420-1:gamma-L-glutamate ligase